MTKLVFHKMHGLGNDFAIFDLRQLPEIYFSEEQITYLAKRKYGIGFDQMAVLYASEEADSYMKIYNLDGSDIAACGNVTRCVTELLAKQLNKADIVIKTDAALLQCKKLDNGLTRVNLGQVKRNWQDIPLSEEVEDTSNIDFGLVELGAAFAVNVGNPHLVFFHEDIDKLEISKYSFLENHDLFPEKININFVQQISDSELKIKTWERGAGQTLACGTGASASFFAAFSKNMVKKNAKVKMLGGDLNITLDESNNLIMTGDVNYVYSGHIELL